MLDSSTIAEYFGEMPCRTSGSDSGPDILFVFWVGNLLKQVQWISESELQRVLWGGPWKVEAKEKEGEETIEIQWIQAADGAGSSRACLVSHCARLMIVHVLLTDIVAKGHNLSQADRTVHNLFNSNDSEKKRKRKRREREQE